VEPEGDGPESANRITPIAVTTEAAFITLHAVGEVGADDPTLSVNPDADSFSVFHNNFLFVDSGPAITNGHGTLLCSPPKVPS
jgi:hypothetical protein